jgi:GGDEF domain-containing protein
MSIDGLDELTQTHGHDVEDPVFRATAQTLGRNAGPADVVGKWSQRQFLAVVADCTERGLDRQARLLERLVRLIGIPWWGDMLSITLSASASLAVEGDTAVTLINRVEEALERNASEARGPVVVL